MDISVALPTFLVTLREGFEAALVVGIVMACLQKAQQTQLYRWVYLGISGGIGASILVGCFLGGMMLGVGASDQIYAPVLKALLEGVFGLVAIAMLSWMLIWMTQQAQSVKADVEGAVSQTLAQDKNIGKGIFLLIFVAVLREGFETVLFIIAKFQTGWAIQSIGAVAGLLTATCLGFLLFKGGIQLNIRLFFQMLGIVLLLIIGGLFIGALHEFDEAVDKLGQIDLRFSSWCFSSGLSCILGPRVWDGSEVLPDTTFPGIFLKTLFGYRQSLYLGQIVAYVAFLGVIGTVYFQSLGDRLNSQKSAKSSE